MKKLSVLLTFAATPALAAEGPFVSLFNTNFVVLVAFLLFVGVLISEGAGPVGPDAGRPGRGHSPRSG